ncbi:MAG: PD-(D/E)XK nuclease superfamily protein [uncultured Sulfurovum sp.]|uniref:PD-(D/E)XK nuclease superfamily protein n=1 Tax=uncultured Sulfurovum sp. TaxID=269237 RepID=A0A6S6RYW2_9BACT|nr:MAG: PD-(D/E)XK nuclease superfamily protein [uncultured Sulfurovum sp.]
MVIESKRRIMKKIIYGNSNFRKIKINNDYFYVDKTHFIETLENLNEDFVIFLRPRRFGKSLFLSTLQYYYDEKSQDEFEAMFHDTYIGQHSTPLKNSFRILFFEFSGINVDSSIDKIYERFTFKTRIAIRSYLQNYAYEEKYIHKLEEIHNPTSLMEYFFEITKNDKIYLLIDEYDQFANAILAYNMNDFLEIVGKGGFVRSFYEVLKTATFSGTVQKMFITGVTPITLDSLSSGFNIVSNISHKQAFNALAGFTQEEVAYVLENSIFQKCKEIDQDVLLEKIKTWYNGYLFSSEAEKRIYNATLVNYFISNFNYEKCRLPKKMLDANVASDYKAIMKLFNIGDADKNYDILKSLIEENSVTGMIKDRYDLNKVFSRDDFITLIYSMGFITIKEELFSEELQFQIPNYVIKMLYFNYFALELQNRNNLKMSTDIKSILRALALGDTEPFSNQLNEVIKTLSNRDHYGFDEKHFHSIVLSLLSFAEFYFIDSQPEKNNKYPDILLLGRDEKVPNNYLFELKWLKSKDNYKSIKKEGINQVKGYLKLDSIQATPKLRAFLLIGSKDGVEFVED